jgi:hypothetical protein
MGPITPQTLQLLTEARERISIDLKNKYTNFIGDAKERIVQAIGELDRYNGKLPPKRVRITPEDFNKEYLVQEEEDNNIKKF